jgi:catalase
MAAKKKTGARATTTRAASHPALPSGLADRDPQAAAHASAGQHAAELREFNADKPREYEPGDFPPAPEGEHVALARAFTASSLSEENDTGKTNGSVDRDQPAPPIGGLGRDRVAAAVVPLTTNQGVAVADNQSSLKAGLRGPTLLADFILREKITHFDHERIPERVVHARGSAAHGFFECTDALTDVTRAAPFQKRGKRTPVFTRFSTVAGERGSKDTARDVRGFAVKFYTDEGNWDPVGNNMPVFFIQDAMKFPDLVHAVRPEPHNGIPQAASAHDTFWDFVSLMPESTHMLCWVMSDRAIPRSFRMMQGFGVHTYRFIDAAGTSTFVKFHWTPKAGVQSLVWDEAVKISGADPDFHRRDLWEAIEQGAYPEWTLGVQLFTEEQAEHWSFDVLDATKIVPEELVPIRIVGRLVLNRNPDNFFAETEQVAFCTAHVVPGIDFSNDPLLAGRHHSYIDTQLSRLGGPNFHELPINASLVGVANNQRDGIHRMAIHRGKVAYEPNSLGGGCPFQAGSLGFVPFPAIIDEPTLVRGKPERFAEHYAQAKLFATSLSESEFAHMEGAFRFELSKVTVPAIRQRMIAGLRHVDDAMASRLARDLAVALPDPAPLAMEHFRTPEVEHSPALSQNAYRGDGSIATRRIAILLADGVAADDLDALAAVLAAEGAVPCFIAPRLVAADANGEHLPVDATYENTASSLFDAVVVPGDSVSRPILQALRQAREFLAEQYQHGKAIGILNGKASDLTALGPVSQGVVVVSADNPRAYVDAVAAHRHERRAGS